MKATQTIVRSFASATRSWLLFDLDYDYHIGLYIYVTDYPKYAKTFYDYTAAREARIAAGEPADKPRR